MLSNLESPMLIENVTYVNVETRVLACSTSMKFFSQKLPGTQVKRNLSIPMIEDISGNDFRNQRVCLRMWGKGGGIGCLVLDMLSHAKTTLLWRLQVGDWNHLIEMTFRAQHLQPRTSKGQRANCPASLHLCCSFLQLHTCQLRGCVIRKKQGL